MSFDPKQFRDLIERTLKALSFNLDSPTAVNLLLGTAAVESNFGKFLRQRNGGTALGVFQMEPKTEIDIWDNSLDERPTLVHQIRVVTNELGPPHHNHHCPLETNLAYQIVMARMQYKKFPEPLPRPDDIESLARYWKNYYNTIAGDGVEERYIEMYKRYVGVVL